MKEIKKIALIDDEPGVLKALSLLLNAIGYEASTFERGIAFLESLETSEPELILCDLKMPEMDGFEVIEKAHEAKPTIPIVLISAHATKDDVEQAKLLGAVGFLAKPFSPQDLKELIQQL